MAYTPIDQNYNTDSSRVLAFKDFKSNIEKENAELKKVSRSFTKNDNDVYNLPTVNKFKFNKVTQKMDDDSKEIIDDAIEAADEITPEVDHKYKIVVPDAIKGLKEEVKSYTEFSKLNENSIDEDEDDTVRVKHIVEYLNELDPEMKVYLDKDGWDKYYKNPIETVRHSSLFNVWENTLTINN